MNEDRRAVFFSSPLISYASTFSREEARQHEVGEAWPMLLNQFSLYRSYAYLSSSLRLFRCLQRAAERRLPRR